jgi:hypothetical protein
LRLTLKVEPLGGLTDLWASKELASVFEALVKQPEAQACHRLVHPRYRAAYSQEKPPGLGELAGCRQTQNAERVTDRRHLQPSSSGLF